MDKFSQEKDTVVSDRRRLAPCEQAAATEAETYVSALNGKRRLLTDAFVQREERKRVEKCVRE